MKLEVSKQYKTAGGTRAIVLKIVNGDGVALVWHESDDLIRCHSLDGGYKNWWDEDSSLVSEWVEPLKGKVLLNVIVDKCYGGATYQI